MMYFSDCSIQDRQTIIAAKNWTWEEDKVVNDFQGFQVPEYVGSGHSACSYQGLLSRIMSGASNLFGQ